MGGTRSTWTPTLRGVSGRSSAITTRYLALRLGGRRLARAGGLPARLGRAAAGFVVPAAARPRSEGCPAGTCPSRGRGEPGHGTGLPGHERAHGPRLARQARPGRAWPVATHSTGVRVHPSANVVGPVVLQDGAEVEEAPPSSPTVVGRADAWGPATVAQCVIGAGQVVTPARRSVMLLRRRSRGRPREGDGAADPGPQRLGRPTFGLSASPGAGASTDAQTSDGRNGRGRGLVLLAPLGLLIAALIKLESKDRSTSAPAGRSGGALPLLEVPHHDRRGGRAAAQARPAEQVDGPSSRWTGSAAHAGGPLPHDHESRTRFPQLWNVLVGQMSLVALALTLPREPVCIPWREAACRSVPVSRAVADLPSRSPQGRFPPMDLLRPALRSERLALLDLEIMALTFLSFARGGPSRCLGCWRPRSTRARARRRAPAPDAAPDPGRVPSPVGDSRTWPAVPLDVCCCRRRRRHASFCLWQGRSECRAAGEL